MWRDGWSEIEAGAGAGEGSHPKRSRRCRVGKCHGYDGYIRVKKLASWGKKFGRPK